MVLTGIQRQAQDAMADKLWPVLEELLRRHAVEILGCNEYDGSWPFLHCFLMYNPPSDLCAKIVDMIVHHIGVEPFMVSNAYNWLPIHFVAFYCHAMTPSVFATLLALTSAAGLRQEDIDGDTPLDDLQNHNRSPHKAALVELYQEALADHATFEARYHPLVSAACMPW